jgi:hypothetical protein
MLIIIASIWIAIIPIILMIIILIIIISVYKIRKIIIKNICKYLNLY